MDLPIPNHTKFTTLCFDLDQFQVTLIVKGCRMPAQKEVVRGARELRGQASDEPRRRKPRVMGKVWSIYVYLWGFELLSVERIEAMSGGGRYDGC